MSMIDTYRNNLQRKHGELVQLVEAKSKERAKIPSLNAKIMSANKTIRDTKSLSTVKTKQGEIDRAEKSLADIDKKIAELEKKIATKEREIATEEKNVQQEEDKINKKRIQEEAKRLKESERRLQSIDYSLQRHNYAQKQMSAEIAMLKYVPEKITVLFFATNPKDTDKLRLDEEARTIQEMIRKSEHRDSISFESRWAVRPLDILQAINELNPDVIHFSGHGADSSELVLENADGTTKLVTKEAITQTIMTSSDKIHLILFNACFSSEQAESVTEYVDAAIGMTASISDAGACTFAAQFYSSLGFGHSLKKAFDQAKGALMLESPAEQDIPQLYLKGNIDPTSVFIVKPKGDA
ncbi:hypothetical protein FACS189479_01130 [Spirochaetia bacterium]|nr:hypothetical protein FACS189479_01130 [Spirochaetia bacterium]